MHPVKKGEIAYRTDDAAARSGVEQLKPWSSISFNQGLGNGEKGVHVLASCDRSACACVLISGFDLPRKRGFSVPQNSFTASRASAS